MNRDTDYIEKARKEYIESDMTWKEVATKHNIRVSTIYDSTLTQIKRLRKHREKLLEREKLYLATEKFIIEKQKEDLERIEKSIAALMS